MNAAFEQYRVETPAFWEALPMLGYTGYDAMELAMQKKWHAVASWGLAGYDLGSWPLVIIFFRNRQGSFDVVEYVEGDVTMYACPTSKIREQITDEIAFYHWKWTEMEWVKDYQSVAELPDELRGPYWSRSVPLNPLSC